MAEGYTVQIDGPLSLFTATTRYGLQMALVSAGPLALRELPPRGRAALGPGASQGAFTSNASAGLVTHQADSGLYVPAEIPAFVERFRQVAPAWELSECTEVIELGRDGVWVPDYRVVHKATGTDVFIEVVGFWKKSSLERLLRLLPMHGPPRFVLAISERLKVDEEALGELPGPILRFKEIPNASELAALLDTLVKREAKSEPQV